LSATFVQSRSTTSSGVTTVTLAYTSPNTANNLLVYCTGALTASAGQAGAATDNNTNTISNATTIEGTSNAAEARVDFVQSCHAGSNTVTGHNANSDDIILQIWELAGCATTGQPKTTGTVANSTTLSVSTAASTAVTGDAVVGFFYVYNAPSGPTLAAGASFTNSLLQNATADLTSGMSEFKAATVGGTQTADGSQGGAGDPVAQIVVVFSQAGAANHLDEDYWQGPRPRPSEPFITVY